MSRPKAKYAAYAPPKERKDNGFNGYHGIDLTPDEIEFGQAMERYRRLRHRPYPNFGEVLRVLKSLGYRKVEQC